jgi:hypothetical protein
MAGKVISLRVSTELAYRVAGTLVGIGLAIATAVWETVLSPMHVTIGHSTFRLPIALLIAVVGNAGIVFFTHQVTGKLGLAMIPAVAWLIVVFTAGTKTSEGDLLITGDNWVGITLILLGSLAWAGAGYWLIVAAPRRRAGRS